MSRRLSTGANQMGPELLQFEVPGQQSDRFGCRIPFPESETNESRTRFATMSHGTLFSSTIGVAQHSGITVSHHQNDSFLFFGFSVSGITKTAARTKSQGRFSLRQLYHATCQDSGSVRCEDHFPAPRHAILRGIAASLSECLERTWLSTARRRS